MGAMATHINVKEIIDKETMYFHVDDMPWKTVTLCHDAAKEILPQEGQEKLLARWRRDSHLIMSEDSKVEIWSSSIAPDFRHLPYPDRGTPSAEAHLASFFNWAAAECRVESDARKAISTDYHRIHFPRRIWASSVDTLIEGSRKPDLVLVAPEAQHREIEWKDVVAICEVKYNNSTDLVRDAFLQLGDKANFIFSYQRNRSWLVGIQLCGTQIRLAVFTRGGNARTAAMDVYKDKMQLLNLLSYLADAPAPDLGIDEHMWGEGGNIHWLGAPSALQLVGSLFMSTGTLGKGTQVFAVDLEPDSEDTVHGVLKVSWDFKDLNDHSIHDKLQDRDRDPYLQKTAEGAYIYCPNGSLDQYNSGDEKDWDAASRYNRLVKYPSFWDDETHLRGITVMDRWRVSSISRRSRGGLIEKKPESVREIFRGFMSDPLLDWQFTSANLEDRERNLTIFKTCGVDILWFGTAREMFHGIIGAMVGHRNAFLRRGILHRDPSDGNTMFLIPEFNPLYAVPPRPPKACSHWSPMRFGMLSDWGAAADSKDPQSWIKSTMHTGTLPFISNAILQGCAHEAFSDLESFFWLAYLITCNCDGPFNKHRDWTNIDSIATVADDESSFIPSNRRLLDMIPLWVRPGVHKMSPRMIYSERMNMKEDTFVNAMTPYFSHHEVVRETMKELYRLFCCQQSSWVEDKNRYEMVIDKTKITYEVVLQLFRRIRDEIKPEQDPYPEEAELERARERYRMYLETGDRHSLMAEPDE